MAWGLEARVPFLDKKFLEVAMKVDAKHKEFSKGAHQTFDEDGCPRMEKVSSLFSSFSSRNILMLLALCSTLSEKHSIALLMAER